ncbi:MAG: hypothetical protein EOO28_18050 [Comamonadaceae bacterium]|nr:MAG: hypothetical protein EOO28_18050 [Comamonadaceae bacterium]
MATLGSRLQEPWANPAPRQALQLRASTTLRRQQEAGTEADLETVAAVSTGGDTSAPDAPDASAVASTEPSTLETGSLQDEAPVSGAADGPGDGPGVGLGLGFGLAATLGFAWSVFGFPEGGAGSGSASGTTFDGLLALGGGSAANLAGGAFSGPASSPPPLLAAHLPTPAAVPDASPHVTVPTTPAAPVATPPADPATPPTLRVVDSDGDGLPDATGTAEAGSYVTITDPAGHAYTAAVAVDGSYSLEMGMLSHLLTGTYSAFSTDAFANASLSVQTVVTDITAPPAPSIDVADTRGNGRANMTGTAEPGNTLHITDPSGQTWSTVAQADGRYELEIFAPNPATGVYTAVALDDTRNASQAASTTITSLAVGAPVESSMAGDHPADSIYALHVNGSSEPWPPVTSEVLG